MTTNQEIAKKIAEAMVVSLTKNKSRTRTVFGRRMETIDGKKYRFELHSDGLYVRRLHSHKPVTLAFSTILQRLKIQFDLPLQETFTVKTK
jgi:hypothetical protein